MSSSLFGPDTDRFVSENDLLGLPSTWMNAACMHDGFRRISGWLGLAFSAGTTRAFTCRIKGYKGIFGVLPIDPVTGDKASADYRLFYFPASDDPLLEAIALPAAMAASQNEAPALIRNFTQHLDFAALFAIGSVHLVLCQPQRIFGLSLTAQTRQRTLVPEGLRTEDGAWLVPPGGFEEDFPPFTLAQSLFSVLAAGLAITLGQAPEAFLESSAPAQMAVRQPDGTLTHQPDPEALIRTELLSWGPQARAAWPQAMKENPSDPYRLTRVLTGLEELSTADVSDMKRPRLVVLSGFLGSGKTSLLNQLIEFHLSHDQLVGVIQNELGATGVDAHLLEGDESVVAMDAGCVCCTLAGSLTRGLRQLSETLGPDVVVLETTGVANPLNMLAELHNLADLAELSSVISVIDAARYDQNLAASDVAADQIEAADLIVLNKCDLVEEAQAERIVKDLTARNPAARVVKAIQGRVHPSVFVANTSRHAALAGPAPCGCCQDHGAHHATHQETGFSALRFALADRLKRNDLLCLLPKLPDGVLRAKGLVRFSDSPIPEIVHYVPGQSESEPAAKPTDDAPFLLVIGQNLDAQKITALLMPFLADGEKQ